MSEPDLSWIDKSAPDAATLERAYALARLKKWQNPGMDKGKAWGTFPTRGALSYRTYVNLLGRSHYCNCASPVYPCKHVLALLLLCRSHSDILGGKTPPDWVDNWIKRAENDPGEAEKEETRRKRLDQKERAQQERLESRQAGARELLRWTNDLLKLGLANAASQPPSFWEEMAARMVDARLGALARRIRGWPELLSAPDGHERLLRELASEHLLAKALLNLGSLPVDLRQTVLTRGGHAWKKESVLDRPPAHDYWLVAGQEHGDSDNTLFFRRTWLLGSNSGRSALLLDFAHGQREYKEAWKVGMAVEGNVHFYPGAWPLRGLLGSHTLSQEAFTMPEGSPTLQAMLDNYAAGLAKDPWLDRFPTFLREVRIYQKGEAFHLADSAEASVPLNTLDRPGWQLLALSARGPISVFGLWDGNTFIPLSAVVSARVIPLVQEEQPGR